MGLIEASEVAWQVGQVNAAQRFAFVGVLSSQRCVQPRLMKRLVETYLVTGEYRAAEKYQDTGIEPAVPGLGNRSTSIIGLRGLRVGRLDSGKTGDASDYR